MSITEDFLQTDDLHPIDVVETIAAHRDWEFDRVTDDQIAMAVTGQWRTYSITLAWSGHDQMLRLICTFEMEPPQDRLPALYETLNATNDMCWAGAFTYWHEQRLTVWRHALMLSDGQPVGADQVDRLIRAAVGSCERFYPAFQLVCWADRTPADALQVAIADAYGRA